MSNSKPGCGKRLSPTTSMIAAVCAGLVVAGAALAAGAASVAAPPQQLAGAPALAPRAVLAAMEKVADWQLAHPIEQPPLDRTWVDGVGYAGYMALAGISGSSRYRDAMRAAGAGLGWQLGDAFYDADDHTTGQMFAELYLQERDPRMIAPLRERFDRILAKPSVGTLAWNTPGVKQRWSWCDSLFMGPPTWARLTAATGDPRYLDFALRNWWLLSDYLYDREEHLFFRDSSYFDRTEANGRKIFWGRGNGWVIAGMARTLQYVPADHPGRARLVDQFRELSAALLAAQQADGMWRASLLDPASYPVRESSASGLILFGLAWGLNQGILPRDRFEPAVRRGWLALNENVQPDGKLVKVQPIGADPKHFDPDATQVYGVGAFLLAGTEIYRMGLEQGGALRVVTVANDTPLRRTREGIALQDGAGMAVMDALTSRILPSRDAGTALRFQADLAPGETRRFLLVPRDRLPAMPPAAGADDVHVANAAAPLTISVSR